MPTILIAGVSGLVGFAAAKHFARLPGWKVVAVSRRTPEGLEGVEVISVDLTDRARSAEVFGRMRDVTHLVYAALYEKPGLVRGWRERDQMETNLRMLEHLFEPLRGAARGLEHVTLLQGTKAYGAHLGPITVPAKERQPRHQHENFYWLQEDYLRARQAGQPWHWTILRPQVIFGESLGSHMNVIPAIGVYAALLKEAGRPLSFPGGPSWVREAVDADLLARVRVGGHLARMRERDVQHQQRRRLRVAPGVAGDRRDARHGRGTGRAALACRDDAVPRAGMADDRAPLWSAFARTLR